MSEKQPPGIAVFDSAAGFLRGLASFLHGEDFPALGQDGLAPKMAPMANYLPASLREKAFAAGGPSEAVAPDRIEEVDAERIAEWIAGLYPRRKYPAVMIGSSNGALAHACALLGIPWLPQTFLTLVRQDHPGADDAKEPLEAARRVAGRLLERNPNVALHQMHDPNQDRRMTPYVSYFRQKYLRLPRAYRDFLDECLAPGGTVYLAECDFAWPVTRVSDRHVYQFGAAGGASREEYFEGGPRVEQLFRTLGIDRRRWEPPAPDLEAPEAEWGFRPELRADVTGWAERAGAAVMRIGFAHPEHPSPAVADLFRGHYRVQGIEPQRLVVPSFILHDPYWTLRTASVPFWMEFNVLSSQDRIRDYVARTGPWPEIGLMLFPNGTEAVGQGSIEDWRTILGLAQRDGYFLGVDEKAYPRDFAALKRYHQALRALEPHHDLPPPCSLRAFEAAMADHGLVAQERSASEDRAPARSEGQR